MSEVDGTLEPRDALTEQVSHYRDVRERIERAALPLATSIDGRVFEVQASLHGLSFRRGAYVVLEHEGAQRFGQLTDLASQTADVDVPGADGSVSSVRISLAVGHGPLFDEGEPFHGAHARPAEPAEVAAWLGGTRRRDRASLAIGELLLAPGVPAELDSGGFNRHTFMCGQSGSGKTYSLG